MKNSARLFSLALVILLMSSLVSAQSTGTAKGKSKPASAATSDNQSTSKSDTST